MKLQVKQKKENKYQLVSGDELVSVGTSIQQLVDSIGCSWSYAYSCKNKDINKDGSWSFNFKGYNYTIIKIIN